MAAASPALAQPAKAQAPAPRAPAAPLLTAGCAYAAGIMLGRYLWNPASWWIFASVAVLCIAAWFLTKKRFFLARVLSAIAFVLIGALGLQLAYNNAPDWPDSPDFAKITDGRESVITAHVTRTGILEQGAVPRESVDVETEDVASGEQQFAMHFGIRLSVYGTPEEISEEQITSGAALPRFAYGQRLKFTAHLRQPRNFMDEGAFDYRGYLAQQNIFALASARADRIEILPGYRGSRPAFWRSRIRQSLLEKIHELWPGRDGALMAAMLLGDRTGVDRETTLDYQRTGAYHILVVAGLKVGILAVALLWLFGLLRAPDWISMPATIAAIFFYAWITEANAPVVRAAVMLALYLVARAFYRERSPMNAVAAAALVLLSWDPRALWEASFQLTFISILAIAGIALPIMERSSSALRRALRQLDSTDYDFALSPRLVQWRLDLRLIMQRLSRFLNARVARRLLTGSLRLLLRIYDVLLLSAVLQLALAMPMAEYFHRAVTLGLPANAVVVPLHSLLLPAAAAALAVGYISLGIAHAPAWMAAALLDATNHAVEIFARWRVAGFWVGDLRTATPSLAAAIFAIAALIVSLWAARRRKSLMLASLVTLLVAAIWIALPPKPRINAGMLEITALDVGQGDSLLLIAPDGKTLLVDAGGELGAPGGSRFDMGEDVVSPALWARGITHLDAVALTHAHADHIGGMHSVLENFHPRELWIGALPQTRATEALLNQAQQQQIAVIHRRLGETFDFGGAQVRVLGPPADWQVKPEKAQNNDSLVMLARYGRTSALLEGDAEKKVEREIAEEDPQADLLKVAHHGSASSSIPELIAAVHPHFAVISVGYRSPFHHPRPEVLERLAAAHARTFRTDTMGAISFQLDGKNIVFRTFSQN